MWEDGLKSWRPLLQIPKRKPSKCGEAAMQAMNRATNSEAYLLGDGKTKSVFLPI